MVESKPKNYIERLPEIIERREEDISHLDPQMVEILYPERASKEFTLTLVFSPPRVSDDADPEWVEHEKEKFAKARALAEKGRDYRCEPAGGSQGSADMSRHLVSFGIDEVNQLHALYSLVEDNPSCEILVKGKNVPFGRELWLPFFWFFVKDETA